MNEWPMQRKQTHSVAAFWNSNWIRLAGAQYKGKLIWMTNCSISFFVSKCWKRCTVHSAHGNNNLDLREERCIPLCTFQRVNYFRNRKYDFGYLMTLTTHHFSIWVEQCRYILLTSKRILELSSKIFFAKMEENIRAMWTCAIIVQCALCSI